MLPPDVARLFKAPEEERDGLRVDRLAAIDDMIPRPTCCEAAREYPVVTFQVRESPSGFTRTSWSVPMDPRLVCALIGRKGVKWSDDLPVPKFCPFCGTALPKMEPKSPVPDTVCIPEGGYCQNCKSRLRNYLCDPPESAYEPRP